GGGGGGGRGGGGGGGGGGARLQPVPRSSRRPRPGGRGDRRSALGRFGHRQAGDESSAPHRTGRSAPGSRLPARETLGRLGPVHHAPGRVSPPIQRDRVAVAAGGRRPRAGHGRPAGSRSG